MMIQDDGHGNKFIMTMEGTRVPLVRAHVQINITASMLDGSMVGAAEAIAVERTLAAHWFAKYQESLTTIADLREQLQAKG